MTRARVDLNVVCSINLLVPVGEFLHMLSMCDE